MSLIYSRNSIGSNILPGGTPHVKNISSERMLPLFTTYLQLLNKIETNLWQVPLYHNSGVLIAILCSQQYQMLLQNPKTH